MTICKFFDVCPNGGVFSRCNDSGYAAECVPHIFDALENKEVDKAKTPNSARVSVGLPPLVSINSSATDALKELERIFRAQAEKARKPLKVKVRRHKKPECRVEIGNDKLSFVLNGKTVAWIDEEHPFGAFADNRE